MYLALFKGWLSFHIYTHTILRTPIFASSITSYQICTELMGRRLPSWSACHVVFCAWYRKQPSYGHIWLINIICLTFLSSTRAKYSAPNSAAKMCTQQQVWFGEEERAPTAMIYYNLSCHICANGTRTHSTCLRRCPMLGFRSNLPKLLPLQRSRFFHLC